MPQFRPLSRAPRSRCALIACVFVCCAGLSVSGRAAEWRTLLDGDLSAWEIFVGVPHESVPMAWAGKSTDGKTGQPLGLGWNERGIFTVMEEAGEPVLRVSGEIYGGLTSREVFGNYHLRLQFRWGERKWEPRLLRPRDSGILYHCTGEHGAFWNVWMRSLEFQVQEADCGDLYLLGGTGAEVRARQPADGERFVFDPGVAPIAAKGVVRHGPSKEHPPGEWNTLEILTVGDRAIHLVNGEVVLALQGATIGQGAARRALERGRLQIQSEGAEVFYRRVQLQPLTAFPADLAAAAGWDTGTRVAASPWVVDQPELIFSGVQGTTSEARGFTLTVLGEVPAPTAPTFTIVGEDAAAFAVADVGTGPWSRNASNPVRLVFQPPPDRVGPLRAVCEIRDSQGRVIARVNLYGLSAVGLEGPREAPMEDILTTLGYRIDVGWKGLKGNVAAAPLGEEVAAPRFRRLAPGLVTMRPVARYSPDFLLPFGYYVAGQPTPHLMPIGTLARRTPTRTEHNCLFPTVVSGGTQFDPGEAVFGLFTSSPTHVAYSEDELNARLEPTHVAHATRVYPLRDRVGRLLPGRYLVGFEEATNGDYQDYVFVLSNVAIAE